uniref:N-acyl-aromatic-L-amino acid amidohydrolase n=1 Tax=Mastacembelus armatus TaxID=205130 RepID=A0A7N9ASQ9_9TELE
SCTLPTLSLSLSRVAVCGGTHGNELSGVYLVRELVKVDKKAVEKKAEEEEPASVLMVLSNPRAIQQGQRYVDTDLNRCFTHAILNGPMLDTAPYEMIRSRELNGMLGPKGSPEAVDLVCDLHNTTANMGLCLIAYSDCDWICLHIFRHLQVSIPLRYIHFDVSNKESYSLDSVGKHGFAMEIGAQPHSVVRSNIYTAMKLGVQHMLDWVRSFNSGTIKHLSPNECFCFAAVPLKNVSSLDRDFCLLHPGDPLFQTFSGETLTYKGHQPLYPFFINECAYYEKGIALSLARRKRVMVPAIRVQTEQEQRANEPRYTSEEEE